MREALLVGLPFTVLAGCGDTTEQQAQKQLITPEQAFYEQYPYKEVRGLNSRVGPAPFGDPKTIAEAAIRYNEHSCPTVTGAVRIEGDGSITAKCSNGERYSVFKVEAIEQPMAMKCSALKELMKIESANCEAI